MAIRTGRTIVGVIFFIISLVWFFYAVGIAARQSSFANAVGWAIPFFFILISIYLIVTGAVEKGRYGVGLGVAVCGLVVVIGGLLGFYITASWPVASLAPVWTAIIGIGTLLLVPRAVYLARHAKTR